MNIKVYQGKQIYINGYLIILYLLFLLLTFLLFLDVLCESKVQVHKLFKSC